MPVKVTIEFMLDQESLAAAAALTESLQDQFGGQDGEAPSEAPGPVPTGPGQPPDRPTAPAPNAAEFVERWLPHLGPGSRSFWRQAAEFARTHANFTFEDLSRTYNVTVPRLRSFHRNSYRAVNHENAPDPLPGEWDAQIRANVYWMTDSVRDRILELTRNDPR